MTLAASFAAQGMRPASFLPAIKCSSCGEEIEIAAMGDHICTKAPPSPRSQPASLTNPFTIRQMNAHGHMPHAPSPLQQQQNKPVSLPKTRVRAPTVSSNQMPAPKAVRPPPPRINSEAANMPFLAPRPPRSDSPLSPALSVRSGSSQDSRPPPIRSMTSPMPRIFDPRPPSPEMSANLDCAFPPFMPATGGSRPGTSNGRKTPTLSERAPSRGSSRHDSSRVASHREPFTPEARSPMSNGGENATGKTNTLKSGPFDPNRRRPSDQAGIAHSMGRRRRSMSSLKLGQEPPRIPDEPVPRPSTSHSNSTVVPRPSTANGSGSAPDRQQVQKQAPPPRPARPAEGVLSPRFVDKLSAEPVVEIPSTFSLSQPPVPVRSGDRSRTFPIRQGSGEPENSLELHKTPSEPLPRGRDHRPVLAAGAKSEPSQIPQAANRQQSQSRSAPRTDHRLQDAPPVPRPVQQHRQEKSHTPSGSGSSVASSAPSLGNSNSSSGPSPVGSAASSVDALSPLTYDPRYYGDEAGMRVPGLNVKAQKPGMRAEQPASRSPPRNFTRPSVPKEIVAPPRSPTLPSLVSPPLESPMDPALQGRMMPARSATEPWRPAPAPAHARPTMSRTATMPESRIQEPARAPAPPTPALSVPDPKPGDHDYDPYRPASPAPAARSRSKSNAAPPQFKAYTPPPPPLPPPATQTLAPTQYKPAPTGSSLRPRSPQPVPAPPPIPQETPRAPPLARRPTTTKPTCRGCSLPIEGKSVKAADGRLTGRWHKSCFTCRACEQPFTTADFYVMDDQPYCEQHYHEENGSLCQGCQRGIEGLYLETTSTSGSALGVGVGGSGSGGGSVEKKFHPRCFTCWDCREVLAEDYFEIAGRVFCERHALAAMRGQARMVGPGSVGMGMGMGVGVGVGVGGGGLSVPDKKALTAERRTTRLMMM